MSAGNSEVGSAFITIYPKVDSNFRTTVTKGLNDIPFDGEGERTGSAFGKGFKNAAAVAMEAILDVLQDIVGKALQIIGSLAREAMSNEDALIKYQKSMRFAGFDEAEIEAASAAMKQYADETIFELQDIVYLTGQLAGVGVDNYEQLAEATANLTAAAGKGATEFGYMSVAMAQINTAGVLHMQDWKQVMNAIGGTGARAITDELEAMGAWDAEMMDFNKAMEEGEISAEEFNQAIMNLGMSDAAMDAAYSVDTFEGAMGVLRAACVDAVMQIIDTIGMENITAFIQRLAEVIPPMIERTAPLVEEFAHLLYDMLMSIDPEKAGNGVMRTIQLFEWVGDIVFSVIDKIAGMPQALKDTWNAVCEHLSGLWNEVLKPIGEWFANTFSGVFETIGTNLSSLWNDVLKPVWDWISEHWSMLLGVFGGIVDFVSSFNLDAMKQKVQEGLTAIHDFFAQKFDAVKTRVSNIFDSIRRTISEKIEAAKQAVKNAIDKIKSYFNFSWSLPHLKLPHITITGDWGFNPPRVPSFGIEWYGQGGIFDGAEIIGIGESGPEAVVPLAGSAMEPFAAAIASDMGMGGVIAELQALREDVRNVKLYLDGSALVGGIADRMDRALGARQLATARGF